MDENYLDDVQLLKFPSHQKLFSKALLRNFLSHEAGYIDSFNYFDGKVRKCVELVFNVLATVTFRGRIRDRKDRSYLGIVSVIKKHIHY